MAGVIDVSRLRTLGILPEIDQPPFDIVGDVHGCIDELRRLLHLLGYVPSASGYAHPDGRRVVFVGDLVDRGPGSIPVLELVLSMRAARTALLVLGNHDARLLRWLLGRNVRTTFGLAETIAQLQSEPQPRQEALRKQIRQLFAAAPGYLLLDGGRLVVTHGGIRDRMIGSWDGEVAAYCLYGEVEGYSASGKPLRRDWAARRQTSLHSGPYIVYGHNVVSELRWVNHTLDLDTGCVYGGRLSALRYPEMEEIEVSAIHVYAERRS